MTQDEIEHMWKMASNDPHHDTNWHDPVVIAFAKMVAAKEREACMNVAEHSFGVIGSTIALAIKARGEA